MLCNFQNSKINIFGKIIFSLIWYYFLDFCTFFGHKIMVKFRCYTYHQQQSSVLQTFILSVFFNTKASRKTRRVTYACSRRGRIHPTSSSRPVIGGIAQIKNSADQKRFLLYSLNHDSSNVICILRLGPTLMIPEHMFA